MPTYAWTGHVDKNPDGTLAVWVSDEWGWRADLVGTRDPAGGYRLTGTLGEAPEALKIEGVDK